MCILDKEEKITERELTKRYLDKEITRKQYEDGLYSIYLDDLDYHTKRYEKLKDNDEAYAEKACAASFEFIHSVFSVQAAAIKWISFASLPGTVKRTRRWIEEMLNRNGCTMVMKKSREFFIYQKKKLVGEIHFDKYYEVEYFNTNVLDDRF